MRLFQLEPDGLIGRIDVDGSIRQEFRVRAGKLSVTTTWRTKSNLGGATTPQPERNDIYLGNATIHVYDDGLLIRPAWGGGMTRLQGRADKGEWVLLAELLREEGQRALARGSAADVPEALTGIARAEEEPWWEELLRVLRSWLPWMSRKERDR